MSIVSPLEKSTWLALVFGQSFRGAFGPINEALKGINEALKFDSVKVSELSDVKRHKHERTRDELEAFREQLRKLYIETIEQPDWTDYVVRHALNLKDEFDIKTN
jgi:hypothetical protein